MISAIISRRLAGPFMASALGLATLGLGGSALADGSPLETIGQVIEGAGNEPTHIIFLHGIRTDARGASFALQGEICSHIARGCTGVRRAASDVLTLGARPAATFDGQPIWRDDQEWNASRPVVDHYVYERPQGGPVIVDEINWWRLSFPIKCRILVATDSRLAGVDRRTLRLCAALALDNGALVSADDDYHPWLTREQFDQLGAQRPDGGGAPWANRYLKSEILDWGLSDAVVSLGSTKVEMRETVRCALSAIAAFDPARGDSIATKAPLTPPPLSSAANVSCERSPTYLRGARFVIVSHSLGSFMLLDTFAAATGDIRIIDEEERRDGVPTRPAASAADELCVGQGAPMAHAATGSFAKSAQIADLEMQRMSTRDRYASLCFVIDNSYNLYFLANQVPLLEIARIEQASAPADGPIQDTLGEWARLSAQRAGEAEQIVAFSDPGDILTYRVPCIANASVTNIAVHNAFRWFGLFENPGPAHTGYFTNSQVLRTMFGESGDAAAQAARPPPSCS